MSGTISDTIFQKFCALSQKVQKIQSRVEKEEVTPLKRIQLHKKLEKLQENFEDLRDSAASTEKQAKQLFSQFEEMESQIITLYRKVEEGFENFEISLISKEAIDLSQSLATGKMLGVAKKINELRHNVHFLFKHRRPSLKNRKIIQLALKLTDHADAIVQKTAKVPKQHLELIQFLRNLLKEATHIAEEMEDPNEGELMMELYEIAEMLYHKKKEKEGRLRLSLIRGKLSRAQNARLDQAMHEPKELIKILLEIANGDPCVEWQQKSSNVIHILQPA